MLRLVCLLAAAVAVLPAQLTPVAVHPIPLSLERYLELTPDQVSAIMRLNADLARYNQGKASRISQVQTEIQEELQRDSLDAMAIGLRYLELEVIRREMKSEQERTVGEIQKLFTPAQKTKLGALQEVLLRYSTACAAITVNVMEPPKPTQPGFVDFLVGNIYTAYPSCINDSRTGIMVLMPGLSSTQSQ